MGGALPPRSLGADGHHPSIDGGTSNLHRSPAPGSAGSAGGQSPRVLNALVFDAESLDRLFRSTAHSQAVARHIKSVPMRADASDSFGVKAIIALTPDSSLPHTVELPDDAVIDSETHAVATDFGERFSEVLDTKGILGAVEFLTDVEAQRERALNEVQDLYRSLSRHNTGAIQTAEGIKDSLAVVKCASTIVGAGLTLPVVAAVTGVAAVGSLTAFAVGTTYGVSLKVIDNWAHASSADLVLISTKKAAEKTGQKLGKEGAKALGAGYESEAQNLAAAERKIEWLTKRIATSERARDLRRLTSAEAAAQAARNAGRLATGLKAVPYLFFLWSAYGAIDTLHKDLHGQ